MAESEEKLKDLLMKVKEESEKAGLKLSTQKTVWHSENATERGTWALKREQQVRNTSNF